MTIWAQTSEFASSSRIAPCSPCWRQAAGEELQALKASWRPNRAKWYRSMRQWGRNDSLDHRYSIRLESLRGSRTMKLFHPCSSLPGLHGSWAPLSSFHRPQMALCLLRGVQIWCNVIGWCAEARAPTWGFQSFKYAPERSMKSQYLSIYMLMTELFILD